MKNNHNRNFALRATALLLSYSVKLFHLLIEYTYSSREIPVQANPISAFKIIISNYSNVSQVSAGCSVSRRHHGGAKKLEPFFFPQLREHSECSSSSCEPLQEGKRKSNQRLVAQVAKYTCVPSCTGLLT